MIIYNIMYNIYICFSHCYPFPGALGTAPSGMQVPCGKALCTPNLDFSPLLLLKQLPFYGKQRFPVEKPHTHLNPLEIMDGWRSQALVHHPDLGR